MQSLRKLCLVLAHSFLVTFTFSAMADTLPVDYNPESKTAIKYDDLDFLLKQTVLKTGRSDHIAAPKPPKITGSSILFDNPMPSRLEGNRVLFHQNKEDLISISAEIRDVMLNIPNQVKISRLNKDEQLAYWLNLHNIIVYHEIAALYPITDLSNLMKPCPSAKSIRCEARYNLAGQLISLDDIEQHIITNWDNPLVIYGFYMGAVGTPNIQGKAFSGATVYSELRKNAVDFIHSVRGTRVWTSKQLKVSEYYTRMAKFFPNFETDVLAHIRNYAEPDFYAELHRISKVKANIEDWHIADLYNGHLSDPAGVNGLQRITSRIGSGNDPVPAHVSRLLDGVVARNSERQANVSVEEYTEKPALETETPKPMPEDEKTADAATEGNAG
ncbi:DUF547 domain-containing protein [Kordiimonas pumila]|uniref:DUF547 domain-containing protein n=1 Tax=Kordiimonas pumila TaxID=2161677 RepID=A0ABV7D1B3_9PROT|nr:DUF547 domain-containing protein [Kordiimonas pumila]